MNPVSNPRLEHHLDGEMAKRTQLLKSIFGLQTFLFEDLSEPTRLDIDGNNMAVVVNGDTPCTGYTAVVVGHNHFSNLGRLVAIQLPPHNYFVPLNRVVFFDYSGNQLYHEEFFDREPKIPTHRQFQP